MRISPIYNEPALLIQNNENTMVIADLHIGIEDEIRNAGFNIPSQTEKMVNKIHILCKKHNINNLVILGDVKHEVPGISRQEYKELPLFFEKLEKIVKIYLTIGNHDTGIKRFISKDINIFDSKGFVIDNIGFFHGHAWPSKKVMECEYVIMGHLHSTISFKDHFGGIVAHPCWIRANFDEIARKYYNTNAELIIMPAFNQLCGGSYYYKNKSVSLTKPISPILTNKLIDIDNARVYLLDGTFFNKIDNRFKIKE